MDTVNNSLSNKKIIQSTKHYVKQNTLRSVFEISITFLLLFVVAGLAYFSYQHSLLFYLCVFPLLSFLYIRLFTIQHDLGHGALFKSKKVNRTFGYFCSVIMITPFLYWRKAHAIHHGTGCNLDKRPSIGGIDTYTTQEYKNLSKKDKNFYRLYRNPLIMFIIGPFYVFFIEHRFIPKKKQRKYFHKVEKRNVMMTNYAALFFYGTMILTIGFKFFMVVYFFPIFFAGMIGVFLFYCQHNFETAYHARSKDWGVVYSAIKGSSYIKLPKILAWLTCNIGYHHLHTLNPKIPFYRLPEAQRNLGHLFQPACFNLIQLFSLVSYKLYDEHLGKMISWKEYYQTYPE